MPIDLSALRAVAEAATPGPWPSHLYPIIQRNGPGWAGRNDIAISEADAAHIAAWNPQTAIAVLDELDALREELRQCEADNTAACDERDALRERVAELEDLLHDYVVAEPAGWQDLRDDRDTALARAEKAEADVAHWKGRVERYEAALDDNEVRAETYTGAVRMAMLATIEDVHQRVAAFVVETALPEEP